MLSDETRDEIVQFVQEEPQEVGSFPLLPGVWLHIDWSLEDHRDRPVVFVDAEDNGLDGYETPDGCRFLSDVSDEGEDLSVWLEDALVEAGYARRTGHYRFESDGGLSRDGLELFYF